jgi:hypothetical protein
MRIAISILVILLLMGMASFVQAGSDVRSPDYWRESPNRWRSDQWRRSPVNNRNAPYRWNKERWRQSPDNWRNKAYRKENDDYRNSSQNWQQKPYKWNKEKWSNDPNNWRNKAYRFNKKKWQQSPLNWQNSPYRWGGGKERRDGEIDIQMNFEGRPESDPAENAAPPATEAPPGSGGATSPTQDEQQMDPRIVEVPKGAPGTPGRHNGRVLPVIRVHGTVPSEAPRSGQPTARQSERPKQLDGFAVYGSPR